MPAVGIVRTVGSPLPFSSTSYTRARAYGGLSFFRVWSEHLVSLETIRDGTSNPIEDYGTRDLTDIIRDGLRLA
jgi:hypothetical protein